MIDFVIDHKIKIVFFVINHNMISSYFVIEAAFYLSVRRFIHFYLLLKYISKVNNFSILDSSNILPIVNQ